MKRTSMLKPEFEERSFGSAYDPLLNGVAQGLAQLFPPVLGSAGPANEAPPPCETGRRERCQDSAGRESRRHVAQRSGEEKRGSRTRA